MAAMRYTYPAERPHYIREWRQFRGIRKAELARRTGLSKASITRIERGSQQPPLDTLRQIGDALGVQVGMLISTPPTTHIQK